FGRRGCHNEAAHKGKQDSKREWEITWTHSGQCPNLIAKAFCSSSDTEKYQKKAAIQLILVNASHIFTYKFKTCQLLQRQHFHGLTLLSPGKRPKYRGRPKRHA